MSCGSLSSHCCSKLCTPLRGEQQATQCVDTVAKNAHYDVMLNKEGSFEMEG